MIQVLGLRDYPFKGVMRKREVFFNKGWRLEKVQDVFNPEKLDAVLAQIDEEERYNLYFTVADCYEEAGRKLKEQWAIPFDIDGLHLEEGKELEMAERAARASAKALGVTYEDMAVVFTGNGVQFFIFTVVPIVDEEYFEKSRDAYGILAKKIQLQLAEQGIQGEVDTSVWSKARIMRLPSTINRKPGKIERRSYILSQGGKSYDFDVIAESGIKSIEIPQAVSDVVIKNYPKPDTKAICAGCKFLIWCKEKPEQVKEPQWYAMASITARLEDGPTLTHEYSQGHPSYNHYETELKIEQSLKAAGPRTCKDIERRWNGCSTCDYYGKVTSPIMIKGPDYIASRDFGFRERKQVGDGTMKRVVPGRPVYTDLIKEFAQQHQYKVVSDNDQVIIFNGKHWGFMNDRLIFAWVTRHVKPEPTAAEMREFIAQLKAYNVTSLDELHQQKEGFMNFQNCVLNVMTGETTPHAADYGFFDVRPYAYDARATAPLWDKFLLDVMEGDEEMANTLKEFGGYAISGDSYWLHKALLLVGDGANGKSVFMEMLGEVVGRESHAAIALQDLDKDTMRYHLLHKLFNYSEETSVRALSDSSFFKAASAGGLISVKQLYVQPFQIPNRAKIIMSANNMPHSMDKSDGLLRRLAIIHFNVKFEPGDGKHDYFIKDKLRAELPGICNILLKSYKDLKARGVMLGQEKLKANLRKYQEESDTVLMFVNDVLMPHDGAELKVSEAYEEYRNMCEMGEFKPVNKIAFGKLFHKHTGASSEYKKVNGESYRVYKNYKLNKGY